MRPSPVRESALASRTPHAAIALNYTLPPAAPRLWATARLRVAADGGANRLYDELPALLPGLPPKEVREAHLPHCVVGDLDSIRPEVLAFYRQRGVEIVNEDSTDLQKSCAWLARAVGEEVPPGSATLEVAVLGGLDGRFDHQLAALSALHASPPQLRLTLLGAHSAACVLAPGRHTLRPHAPHEGPVCGLVPLAGPAVVTTCGLRWELAGTRLALGSLVSTSNQVAAAEVVVETDAPLVWTTQLSWADWLPGW